jgi:hypothetical protein
MSLMGPLRQLDRGSANGRCRLILPVPARCGGGRLTERTPAVQPRRRERVKVPHSGPCWRDGEPASIVKPDIRSRFLRELADCSAAGSAALHDQPKLLHEGDRNALCYHAALQRWGSVAACCAGPVGYDLHCARS